MGGCAGRIGSGADLPPSMLQRQYNAEQDSLRRPTAGLNASEVPTRTKAARSNCPSSSCQQNTSNLQSSASRKDFRRTSCFRVLSGQEQRKHRKNKRNSPRHLANIGRVDRGVTCIAMFCHTSLVYAASMPHVLRVWLLLVSRESTG